jgi:hypothetical protein
MLHSTDEYSASSFRPHGRVDSYVEGRIFIQKAKGPFNEEIVSAICAVHARALDGLKEKGAWGAIFHIGDSALTSLPMLRGLTEYLRSQVKAGSASVGTAIVMGHDVDGAAMMAAHYVKAWSDAGIQCKYFSNFDDGKSWIDGLLLPCEDSQGSITSAKHT